MSDSKWKYCSNCGAEIVPPGIFCMYCGKKITESVQKEKIKEPKKEGVCSKCGGNLDDWGYCQNCKGYSI